MGDFDHRWLVIIHCHLTLKVPWRLVAFCDYLTTSGSKRCPRTTMPTATKTSSQALYLLVAGSDWRNAVLQAFLFRTLPSSHLSSSPPAPRSTWVDTCSVARNSLDQALFILPHHMTELSKSVFPHLVHNISHSKAFYNVQLTFKNR